jgi:HNH endonuclease
MKKWSASEIRTLKKLFPINNYPEIAKIINRTPAAINSKASELKLKKLETCKWFQKPWTDTDDKVLKTLYPTLTLPELCLRLNRKPASIQNRANILGIGKSVNFKNPTYFKKGHKPWNAGLQIKQHPAAIKTRFKKGHTPGNYLPIGSVTIRIRDRNHIPYMFIKLAEHKWVTASVAIWEYYHGKIPTGMVVTFINGDTMDPSIENLKLISRVENGIRNSGSIDLKDSYIAARMCLGSKRLKSKLLKRPDILELKRKQYLLNRTIKNRNDERNQKTRSDDRKNLHLQK